METFHGLVETTQDALLLFEAVRIGVLHAIQRRLKEDEKEGIRSGGCFVYCEDSGIKRWTDKLVWGPSRILGHFLIYRELEIKIPPSRDSKYDPKTRKTIDLNGRQAVVGSKGICVLRDNGMYKKTIAVRINNKLYHIVNYYSQSDLNSGILETPRQVPEIAYLVPDMNAISLLQPYGGKKGASDAEEAGGVAVRSNSDTCLPLEQNQKQSGGLIPNYPAIKAVQQPAQVPGGLSKRRKPSIGTKTDAVDASTSYTTRLVARQGRGSMQPKVPVQRFHSAPVQLQTHGNCTNNAASQYEGMSLLEYPGGDPFVCVSVLCDDAARVGRMQGSDLLTGGYLTSNETTEVISNMADYARTRTILLGQDIAPSGYMRHAMSAQHATPFVTYMQPTAQQQGITTSGKMGATPTGWPQQIQCLGPMQAGPSLFISPIVSFGQVHVNSNQENDASCSTMERMEGGEGNDGGGGSFEFV